MFFLVRHATHDWVGRVLVGARPGVRLNAEGRRQAECLAERFRREQVDLVQSSPSERARETAAPMASRCGLRMEIAPGLDELDFGDWAGRSFASLAGDRAWEAWNRRRSEARPPGGETMRELQARVVGHLETMRAAMPDARIVLVSHAETIRAAIMHYLGIPLDDFARIELAPASISTIDLGHAHCDLMGLNQAVAA